MSAVKKIFVILAAVVTGIAAALFLGAGLEGSEHVSGVWFGVLVAAIAAVAVLSLFGRRRGGSGA